MFQSALIPDLSGVEFIPGVHGEADGSAGGGLVGLLDKLLENITRYSEPNGGIDFMPGIRALDWNIHPLLVHFPIAFLTGFFLFELLNVLVRSTKLHQIAGVMLYCGTLGALATASAGLYAASIVPHGEDVHEIMEWHERLGLTVTSLAVVLSVWRLASTGMISGMSRAFYVFLSVIMTVCMIVGADLGGLMVYQHGVAVRNLQQPDEHHHHTAASSKNNASE